MSITQVSVTTRHETSRRLHSNRYWSTSKKLARSDNTRGSHCKQQNIPSLLSIKGQRNHQFKRVNNTYLGEFVLPLVTDMSVILVVQMIRFIVVSCSQDCHKSRVATALLSNIKTPPNQITFLIKRFSKLQRFVRKTIKRNTDKNSIPSQTLNPLSTTRLINLKTAFPLQKRIKCFPFTRKRAGFFKFFRFEERFRKALLLWRISVDGSLKIKLCFQISPA